VFLIVFKNIFLSVSSENYTYIFEVSNQLINTTSEAININTFETKVSNVCFTSFPLLQYPELKNTSHGIYNSSLRSHCESH